MAEILEVMDISGFPQDVQTVINGIQQIEDKIEEASGKVLTVQVQLQGAESLTQLTEATAQYKQAVIDLGGVQQQQTGIMQQYGAANVDGVKP